MLQYTVKPFLNPMAGRPVLPGIKCIGTVAATVWHLKTGGLLTQANYRENVHFGV